jgi:hypothetical protein
LIGDKVNCSTELAFEVASRWVSNWFCSQGQHFGCWELGTWPASLPAHLDLIFSGLSNYIST